MFNRANKIRNEAGYTLITMVVLMAVALYVGASALKSAGAKSRTVRADKVRTQQFHQTEQGSAHALQWLRENSQKLLTPFTREEFYLRFERTAFSTGSNDSSAFSVPTRVKLVGTTTSALLVSDSTLGTAAFPVTKDITTGTAFDAITDFDNASFGVGRVRLTIVDVIADDPTLDFGAPPAADPGTDFFPVYRIDVVNELGKGSHVYSFVTTDVIHEFDYGIYGQDYLEFRQTCDSYDSSAGVYTSGSKRAKCTAGSNSSSQIHKSEALYGSLQTNGDIVEENPFGGDVCADFTAGCPNEGDTCSGEDCGVPLLESYDSWATYCPSDQGSTTITGAGTLTVASDAPGDKCWDTVTVSNNSILTLETTDNPYFIKVLDLQNSSNSQIDIVPSPATGTVTLYVEQIVGDTINGNQTLNAGRPIAFKLVYLGTNTLLLNGNANMNTALVAPNARVNMQGNFDYHGALLAKELSVTGSGSIHYDESLGGSGKIADTQYRMRLLSQYYR